jgi:hypothetical protein
MVKTQPKGLNSKFLLFSWNNVYHSSFDLKFVVVRPCYFNSFQAKRFILGGI